MAHTSVMWNSTQLKKMMVVGSHLTWVQMICVYRQSVRTCVSE